MPRAAKAVSQPDKDAWLRVAEEWLKLVSGSHVTRLGPFGVAVELNTWRRVDRMATQPFHRRVEAIMTRTQLLRSTVGAFCALVLSVVALFTVAHHFAG